MKAMINDVLRGENRLLYTYGVTNSGKTYTIQGELFSVLQILLGHINSRVNYEVCLLCNRTT